MTQLQGPFSLPPVWLDAFTDWLRHFIPTAKPTAEDPVINIEYDVSCTASGHTQILLLPKFITLCVVCVTKK
jgi:hypothetical protein